MSHRLTHATPCAALLLSIALASPPAVAEDFMANLEAAQQRAATAHQSEILSLILVDRHPMPTANVQLLEVDRLLGQPVENWQAVALGTVERVATDGRRTFLVLGADSPLSDAETQVLLPVQTVALVEGGLVMRGMTTLQLKTVDLIDPDALDDMAGTDTVRIALP